MPLNWLRKGTEVEPYSHIAGFYDHLMRHVNYPRWFEYIQQLLNRFLLNHQRLLEAACGTGRMLERFALAGWEVYGFDRSLPMVQVARKRLQQAHVEPMLWVGDMRAFAIAKPMDAVLCLYDSMNYCLHEDELLAALKCIHAALAEGGVFIFDVVTQRNCRRHFGNYYEKDRFRGGEYIRQSHYEAEKQCQVNEFFVTFRSGKRHRIYERHVQRIYRLEEIREYLKRFSWELLGAFDNFSQKPGTEKSDRVHFVLRKP